MTFTTVKMYESTIYFTLDTICPWTYIALRRLDEALDKVRTTPHGDEVTFAYHYLPYQLHPDFPSTPKDKRTWARQTTHANSATRQAAHEAAMSALGADVGLHLSFAGTISNTLPAHRVLRAVQDAAGPDVASVLVAGLFRRYFEEGCDPASHSTLVAACVEAGIGEPEARALVEDEDWGLAETKKLIKQQEMNGVEAVPHVVVEGRRRDITIVGTKTVCEYVKILETVIKESR